MKAVASNPRRHADAALVVRSRRSPGCSVCSSGSSWQSAARPSSVQTKRVKGMSSPMPSCLTEKVLATLVAAEVSASFSMGVR